MSGERQVNVKSQSELDIGGRETCYAMFDLLFMLLLCLTCQACFMLLMKIFSYICTTFKRIQILKTSLFRVFKPFSFSTSTKYLTIAKNSACDAVNKRNLWYYSFLLVEKYCLK